VNQWQASQLHAFLPVETGNAVQTLQALAQYRMPIVDYWRGLTVQLVAYEVQYQCMKYFENNNKADSDNMDHAFANVMGAIAAVISAFALAEIVEIFKQRYYDRILQRNDKGSVIALYPGFCHHALDPCHATGSCNEMIRARCYLYPGFCHHALDSCHATRSCNGMIRLDDRFEEE
jgi:hypothetical protein